jgi:hypothetical protein
MSAPTSTVARSLLKQSWPDERHELLLQAALNQTPKAIESWETFFDLYTLDHLDEGEFRLLSLAGRNLKHRGYDGPSLAHLKSVHRQSWYRNQLISHRFADLLKGLNDQGITTLLLKGAPLAHRYYEDPGLRPMRDLDVLVPEAQANQAARYLLQLGWRFALPEVRHPLSARFRRFRHSVGLRHKNDELDLHWHALYWARYPEFDRQVWAKAVPFELHGVPTLTVPATVHLLHVCVHGCQWDPVPPIRWIADSMVLLRSPEGIDWPWIQSMIFENHLTLPMQAAFVYLVEHHDAPIPADFMARLMARPISATDIAEFNRLTLPNAVQSLPQTIRAVFREHSRGYAAGASLLRAAEFPAYVAQLWGTEGLAQTAMKAVRFLKTRATRQELQRQTP